MKKLLLECCIIIILVLMVGCGKKGESTNSNTTDGVEIASNEPMISYTQNEDGTYSTTDFTYKYCIELTGRSPGAVADSTFTVLTNDKEVTFNEVAKSLYSSNSKDWLNEDETIIIDMR